MASLRCRGDSDCNKTQIIRNFHLYIIHLWKPFFHIFTHGDVVNAQTWEVSPPKKIQSSHLKYTANVRFKLITFKIENEQIKTAQNYSYHTLLSK